jgi:hypothetical protein
MLATELHLSDVPALYRRFADAIGAEHWERAVTKCEEEIRGNEHLAAYLRSEYAVAYRLHKLGAILSRPEVFDVTREFLRSMYPCLSFVAQVLSLMDSWPAVHAERLRRRVHGCMRNPDDLRGLRLEYAMATHFMHRGCKVVWPEIEENGETFDLLVDGAGMVPLEVECKSIGEDKGRVITRRDIADFVGQLAPLVTEFVQGLQTGVACSVKLPGQFPRKLDELKRLANELAGALKLAAHGSLEGGAKLEMRTFDVGEFTTAMKGGQHMLRREVDRVTSAENAQAIAYGASNGVLLISLQSDREKPYLERVMDTLADAGKRQLTRRRAGLLVASFEALTGDQMRSTAAQDADPTQNPTGLQFRTDVLLKSSSRAHVAGVAYLSNAGTQLVERGLVDSTGGVAYYFPNATSTFWDESLRGLFRTHGTG